MVTFHVGAYRIEVTNDPPHFDGSADNVNSYDRLHVLGDDAHISSRHAIRVYYYDQIVGSCLLSAGGGATGVHDNTATIHGDNCIIAVGSFMASVLIPSLNLNWATQTDDATCFGVHNANKHGCLISHGELLIARVAYDGAIVWQAGGADIFTNGFKLDDEVIHAVDFNDREYVIDIQTGREIAA